MTTVSRRHTVLNITLASRSERFLRLPSTAFERNATEFEPHRGPAFGLARLDPALDCTFRSRKMSAQPAFGISDTFRVFRRDEGIIQIALACERCCRSEKPTFVFSMSQDHRDVQVRAAPFGPRRQFCSEVTGAVVIAVDQHENRVSTMQLGNGIKCPLQTIHPPNGSRGMPKGPTDDRSN